MIRVTRTLARHASRDLLLCAIAAVAFLTALLTQAPGAHASGAPPGGARTTRIVGGVPAEPGEFPWMVRLSMGCGGSLYAPDVVLTAAHCVAGVTDAGTIEATVKGRKVDAVRTLIAPGYEGMGKDWALIELAEPVTGVPLLPANTDPADDEGVFTVAGWGAAEPGGPQQTRLRKVDVPLVPDETCALAGGAYEDLVADEELCAGFPEGGADACQGDSGGPLFKKDASGEVVQVGIVSWGEGCAEPGHPGVYTQVSHFAADIAKGVEALRT